MTLSPESRNSSGELTRLPDFTIPPYAPSPRTCLPGSGECYPFVTPSTTVKPMVIPAGGEVGVARYLRASILNLSNGGLVRVL